MDHRAPGLSRFTRLRQGYLDDSTQSNPFLRSHLDRAPPIMGQSSNANIGTRGDRKTSEYLMLELVFDPPGVGLPLLAMVRRGRKRREPSHSFPVSEFRNGDDRLRPGGAVWIASQRLRLFRMNRGFSDGV